MATFDNIITADTFYTLLWTDSAPSLTLSLSPSPPLSLSHTHTTYLHLCLPVLLKEQAKIN